MTGSDHRPLEHADWIKFAHNISLSRAGVRLQSVIASYKYAWYSVYSTLAPMVNGSPVDHLDDPAYLPSPNIPWFSYPSVSNDEDDHQEQGTPISSSASSSLSSIPPSLSPIDVPSTSTRRPQVTYRSYAPVIPPHTVTLSRFLRDHTPIVSLEGPYPHISAFGYDVKSYMSHCTWTPGTLRVVFVVSALYDLSAKGHGYDQTAYIDIVEYNDLSFHAPKAIALDDSRTDHPTTTKVHVIISSWVGLLFPACFKSLSIIGIASDGAAVQAR